MEKYKNEMPSAALLVWQQKELIKDSIREIILEMGLSGNISHEVVHLPETLNKSGVSEITGYSVNTINRMICDKTIPYYKMQSRVLFKRAEIESWMFKKRISTSAEYIANVETKKKGVAK